MKEYDYLVVGAGLFAAVFGISIARMWMIFMCINMELIYFIQTISRSGIM